MTVFQTLDCLFPMKLPTVHVFHTILSPSIKYRGLGVLRLSFAIPLTVYSFSVHPGKYPLYCNTVFRLSSGKLYLLNLTKAPTGISLMVVFFRIRCCRYFVDVINAF